LVKLKAEQENVQYIVDHQEISPEDVDRMTMEQEQLTKNIHAIKEKQLETTRTVLDLDIKVQRKIDEASHVLSNKNIYILIVSIRWKKLFKNIII
jgi:SMC interacting uncharacterized protein involved in chromosome segregation